MLRFEKQLTLDENKKRNPSYKVSPCMHVRQGVRGVNCVSYQTIVFCSGLGTTAGILRKRLETKEAETRLPRLIGPPASTHQSWYDNSASARESRRQVVVGGA